MKEEAKVRNAGIRKEEFEKKVEERKVRKEQRRKAKEAREGEEKEEKENLRIIQEEKEQGQKDKIDFFRSSIHKPKMVGKIDLDKKEGFKNKELKSKTLKETETETENQTNELKENLVEKYSEKKDV